MSSLPPAVQAMTMSPETRMLLEVLYRIHDSLQHILTELLDEAEGTADASQ